MPLEMRVASRHPHPHHHRQQQTVATAAQADEEEAYHSESSGYSDSEQTADDVDDNVDDDGVYDDDDNDDDNGDDDDNDDMCCVPLKALTTPVEVGELGSYGHAGEAAFWIWPLFGPLLFENTSSDVRDGLANERTFLSYLRLSVTMAVVAVAIVVSFHLKTQPSALELRMAHPLGIIFWLLSILTLFVGVANYIRTINKYSRRQAIVQSGWKTQAIMGTVAFCILGSCVTLLVVNRITENET